MSDRAARFDALLTQRETKCRMARYIDDLERHDADAAAALRRVLAAPSVSIRAIKRELDDTGDLVARETISAHRNGVCSCRDER